MTEMKSTSNAQSSIKPERQYSPLVKTDEKHVTYFLFEDEEQSVYVEEADTINFLQILQHLNSSGSVFISKIKNPKFKAVNTVETDLRIDPVPVTSEEIVKILGANNIEQVDKILDGIGVLRCEGTL